MLLGALELGGVCMVAALALACRGVKGSCCSYGSFRLAAPPLLPPALAPKLLPECGLLSSGPAGPAASVVGLPRAKLGGWSGGAASLGGLPTAGRCVSKEQGGQVPSRLTEQQALPFPVHTHPHQRA